MGALKVTEALSPLPNGQKCQAETSIGKNILYRHIIVQLLKQYRGINIYDFREITISRNLSRDIPDLRRYQEI